MVFFLGIGFVLSKLLLNVFLAVLTTLYGTIWDEQQQLKTAMEGYNEVKKPENAPNNPSEPSGIFLEFECLWILIA